MTPVTLFERENHGSKSTTWALQEYLLKSHKQHLVFFMRLKAEEMIDNWNIIVSFKYFLS